MITTKVDHSAHFGHALDQGKRPTCLAFVVADVNRFSTKAPDVLSAEYLYQHAGAMTPGWAVGSGLYLEQALQATVSHGQPLAEHYPYLSVCPVSVQMPIQPKGADMYKSMLRPIPATSSSIISELSGGHPVGLIVACTKTLFKPVDGVVQHSNMVLPDSAHALVAVGLGHMANGINYILVRNSWGPIWGIQGHAWLPEEYVEMHALEAFGR